MGTKPREGGRAGSELARLLVALRERRGLSGKAAADATPGLVQSRLWRAENDKQVLPERLADAYAVAMQATAEERERLAQLSREIRPRTQRARVTLSRGADDFQREIGKLEKQSALVRTYHPAIVIGVLQTRAYATAIFSPRGVPVPRAAESVEERLARARLLDDESREWILVQSEGALRWQAASPGLMVEQLEHMIEVSRRPNVRLGIVDWRTPADVFAGHGFHIYDQRAVQVGMEVGTQLITDRQDVEQFDELFGDLERLASFDDAGREVLSRIADEYRGLSPV